METKKHLKKDVRTKHTLFTEIGMVIAIAACLWAFSWQRTLHEDMLPQAIDEPVFAIQDMQTPRIEIKKPVLEAPHPPSNSLDNIEVVDDEVAVGEEEEPEETPLEVLAIPISEPENLNILPPITDEPTDFPLVKPHFPNGEKAKEAYMQRYASVYNDGRYNGERKVVIIAFRVETDGTLTNIKILKAFNDEAGAAVLAAFQKMPKWVPGRNQKGQIAPVNLKLPIYYDFRKL